MHVASLSDVILASDVAMLPMQLNDDIGYLNVLIHLIWVVPLMGLSNLMMMMMMTFR